MTNASTGSPSAAAVDGTNPQSCGYASPRTSGRESVITCRPASYLYLDVDPRGDSITTVIAPSAVKAGSASKSLITRPGDDTCKHRATRAHPGPGLGAQGARCSAHDASRSDVAYRLKHGESVVHGLRRLAAKELRDARQQLRGRARP